MLLGTSTRSSGLLTALASPFEPRRVPNRTKPRRVRLCMTLFFSGGRHWPVIRSERRSRKTLFVVEMAIGTSGPSIAHGYRRQYLRTGNHDIFPFDSCVGPMELSIGPCDRKSAQHSLSRFKPRPSGQGMYLDLVSYALHGIVNGS